LRRILPAAALLALPLLAACKVERTPSQFYTERDPAVVERRDAEDEIRGDREGAVSALLPQDLAHVIGVDANAGLVRIGPAGVAATVAEIDAVAPAVARTPDLRVQVELREGLGWFATHVELLPAGPPPREVVRLRASGVMERVRGSWRLVQLHLSEAQAPPPPAPADTSAADPAEVDPAEAGA
jgi:SnoaL-like protein